MNKLIAIAILSVTLTSCQSIKHQDIQSQLDADHSYISCYNGGHLVYRGIAKDLRYGIDFVTFEEPETNLKVFLVADCVIKYKEDTKEIEKVPRSTSK